MKIGDYVRFSRLGDEIVEDLWEVIGFEERCGGVFVLIKHPTIGGRYSFPKDEVVEVICK